MSIKSGLEQIMSGLRKTFEVVSQKHTLQDQLFDNGWYPITYVSRVEKDPNQSINEYMERLILDKYDQIKEYCLTLCPLRLDFLKVAFDLFENGNFVACIPLFLAQTDGIARDYGSKGMFSGRNQKFIPYINHFANQDIKRATFFKLMHSNKFIGPKSYDELPISKHTEKTSPEENSSMNRHGILHGHIEYNGYANKLNALRAICFLLYTINLGEDIKFINNNINV